MANRNIVVIGGSAGAFRTLGGILQSFDAGLPAAVFAVLHIQPTDEEWLAGRLAPQSALPVSAPRDEAIRLGHVYVASPDRHLVIDADHVFTTHAPRENLWRPAIDVLFRSAAVAHASSVIGVLLSGELDDGTSGLQAIKACGGIAVIQDPASASFPAMVEVARANVAVDYCVGAEEIGALVQRLVAEEAPAAPPIPDALRLEARLSGDRSELLTSDVQPDSPTALSWPECGGPLWQNNESSYRCLVGHAYQLNTLAVAHDDALDRTLWAAIRLFEQRANIAHAMSEQTRQRGFARRSEIHAMRASESQGHASRLRGLQARYRALLADDASFGR